MGKRMNEYIEWIIQMHEHWIREYDFTNMLIVADCELTIRESRDQLIVETTYNYNVVAKNKIIKRTKVKHWSTLYNGTTLKFAYYVCESVSRRWTKNK